MENKPLEEDQIQKQLPIEQNIPQQIIAKPMQYPATSVQPSQLISSQMIQGNSQGPIKGESRIEYVPYEKTIIEYEQVERKERIPKERTIIEYEEVVRTEQVPRQKKVTDYYAVEYVTEYIPQVYQDKYIEYVPQERVAERVEYQTLEKQVIHQSVQEQATVTQQPVQTIQYVQQPVQYLQQSVQYVQQPIATQQLVQQQVPQQYYNMIPSQQIGTQPLYSFGYPYGQVTSSQILTGNPVQLNKLEQKPEEQKPETEEQQKAKLLQQ